MPGLAVFKQPVNSLKESSKDPPVLQNYHAGMGLYFMEMTKHRTRAKFRGTIVKPGGTVPNLVVQSQNLVVQSQIWRYSPKTWWYSPKTWWYSPKTWRYSPKIWRYKGKTQWYSGVPVRYRW